MSLQLSPDQEQVVGLAIRAGLIQVPDDVIAVGIDAIRRQLAAHDSGRLKLSPEEWSRELHDFIHSHSTDAPVLDDEAISRESIYGTRGL